MSFSFLNARKAVPLNFFRFFRRIKALIELYCIFFDYQGLFLRIFFELFDFLEVIKANSAVEKFNFKLVFSGMCKVS